MISKPVCLRVKGPFACFTRPEFHVERVSYSVITPSAARGILEAILMKPVEKPEAVKRGDKVGFTWHVLRIGVVKKGTLMPLLRNELKNPQHTHTGYNISGEDGVHTQRHSLILKAGEAPLEYLIEAVLEVPEQKLLGRRGVNRLLAKYHQMFLRRARAGQCHYQPFLGCREFSVSEWELVEDLPEQIPGAPEFEDFGGMFRDFDFDPVWRHWGDEPHTVRPEDGWDAPEHRPKPLSPLHAIARHGWISVEADHDR